MTKFRTLLSLLFLVGLALETLGCGSSYVNSNRVLQSMVITPANADAKNFPNGQVQFTATGTFSKPPSPARVTFQPPYTGTWALMGAGAANIATISQAGLAQCIPGATGAVTVSAVASANSATGPAMSVAVTGSTTLTCP
jgi:hypothetical protein